MRQRLISGVTLAVVVFGTTAMFAHESIRFVGKITKCDQTMLTIECVGSIECAEGAIIPMRLTKTTLVYRDKKKVAAAELKKGLTVVVDALAQMEGGEDDVEAVEIRIVPPIEPSAGK